MARGRYFYREVVPFTAMVIVECANVGSTTLFKAATNNGMSYSVFIVYSYSVAALSLLPLVFFFHRNRPLPSFDASFIGRIFILAALGVSAQMLGYRGIEYGSPTLGSAMSNITPACTFVLAIVLRMEKLELKSSSTQAKIIGTIVLLSGAFLVILYKGPIIIGNPSTPISSLHQSLRSLPPTWATGGLLLAADYVLISVWNIVQAQTVKKYPVEFVIVFLFNLLVAILSAPICFFTEPDSSVWKIESSIAVASILYTGAIGAGIGVVVHTWALKVKGPVYVALFRPLSIAIAAIMGVIFLGETFYLGSLVGSIIISVGFYVVMWGKTKEEMVEDLGVNNIESPSTENAPLLQSYGSEAK